MPTHLGVLEPKIAIASQEIAQCVAGAQPVIAELFGVSAETGGCVPDGIAPGVNGMAAGNPSGLAT